MALFCRAAIPFRSRNTSYKTLAELVLPTLQPVEKPERRLSTEHYTDQVLRREDVRRAKRTCLDTVSRWFGSASWEVPFPCFLFRGAHSIGINYSSCCVSSIVWFFPTYLALDRQRPLCPKRRRSLLP